MKLASLSVLLLATVVCASAVAQNTPPTAVGQRPFTNVEGSDLKSRMSAGVKQGGAQRGRFWVAYSFDVRPGVAFDVAFTGFRGGAIVLNGSNVDSHFETRNLGVFLLHENARVVRGEIYNLDR